MEDIEIVKLYWNRNEQALEETENKYGKYCNYIAFNILQDLEDSKECVNDALLKTWNSIPNAKPNHLKFFIGKITRNIAINIYEKHIAKKRNKNLNVFIEELEECIPYHQNMEQELEYNELTDCLNSFLKNISEKKRKIFIERYWYMCSLKEISNRNGIKENNAKIILHRTRNDLKEYLTEKGVII